MSEDSTEPTIAAELRILNRRLQDEVERALDSDAFTNLMPRVDNLGDIRSFYIQLFGLPAKIRIMQLIRDTTLPAEDDWIWDGTILAAVDRISILWRRWKSSEGSTRNNILQTYRAYSIVDAWHKVLDSFDMEVAFEPGRFPPDIDTELFGVLHVQFGYLHFLAQFFGMGILALLPDNAHSTIDDLGYENILRAARLLVCVYPESLVICELVEEKILRPVLRGQMFEKWVCGRDLKEAVAGVRVLDSGGADRCGDEPGVFRDGSVGPTEGPLGQVAEGGREISTEVQESLDDERTDNARQEKADIEGWSSELDAPGESVSSVGSVESGHKESTESIVDTNMVGQEEDEHERFDRVTREVIRRQMREANVQDASSKDQAQ